MKTITPPLKLRMRGAKIKRLHEVLIQLDYNINKKEIAKKYFGVSTRKAIAALQEKENLAPSGEVDKATATVLNKLLSRQLKKYTYSVYGVIRNELGKPLTGLSIEAWNKNKVQDELLDKTQTDINGQYELSFGKDFPHDYKPELYYKIFSEHRLLKSTESEKLEKVPPGIYNQDFRIKDPGHFEPKRGTIEGRVFLNNRLPAKNLELKFYRKVFDGDSLLQTITTNEQGFYKLEYDWLNSPLSFDVRTSNSNGEEIRLTNVKFNAKQQELINLVVPSDLQITETEYSRLKSSLMPYLQGKNLREAQENDTQQDISFLFQKTSWDARLITLASLADKRSQETGVPAEILYALFRLGLPTGIHQLARIRVDGVEKALLKANEVGITQVDVEAGKKAFAVFAKNELQSAPVLGGVANANDFLDQVFPNISTDSQKAEFTDVYFNTDWRGAELWDKAKEAGVSDIVIGKLKLQGKLAFLTLNNPNLIKKVQEKIEEVKIKSGTKTKITANDLPLLVEIGGYKTDFWNNLIVELSDDPDLLARLIPTLYTNQDLEDRIHAYALDMAGKVRRSYPTQTLAQMIERDELRLGSKHTEIKVPVKQFLSNTVNIDLGNEKTYIPGNVSFNHFLIENQDVLVEGIDEDQWEKTFEAVKKLTRLYQIADSNYSSIQTLYDLGITSAADIVAYPYQDWIDLFGSKFDSPEEAENTYRKSEQITSVVYNFYTAAEQLNNAPATPAGSSGSEGRREIKDNLIKLFPTLETLFGSLDFCDCEHCRSVLSPAAYLMDLLEFLNPDDAEWERKLDVWRERHNGDEYAAVKPFEALTGRRPDIPHIQLSCENTQTALPYIDIVNEILEYYVEKNQLDASVAYDIKGVSSEELLAEPQHIIPGAYQKLSDAVYPVDLPFDLSLEMTRSFCKQFKIPFWKLLSSFRKSDSLFSTGTGYTLNDIFIEQLGLSAKEYELFVNPDLSNWFKLYGYETKEEALAEAVDSQTLQRIDLLSAKTLSRRLNIAYHDLVDLIKTRFLNPALGELAILRKLGITTEELYRWKREPGYEPFSPEELQAFMDKLSAHSSDDFDAEDWLNRFWNAGVFTQIIVLYDDPNPGCNFDETTLCYANTDTLTDLDWMKLNLFVRLWKKLDWEIQDLDAALITFLRGRELTENNMGNELKTVLLYLAHLKYLNEQFKLGKFSQQNWLTVWGDTSWSSQSAYQRYFLKYSILKEDSLFDHPLGKYLEYEEEGSFHSFTWDPQEDENVSTGNVGLVNHLPSVQAALELTEEEIRNILAEIALTIADCPLSMDKIQLFLGYKMLREALKLSITEIITLKHLSGIDPLKQLKVETIDQIQDDHLYAQTIRFLEVAAKIRESGFSIADLNYLIRHFFDPKGPYRIDEAQVVDFIRTLSLEMQRIQVEQAPLQDEAAYSDAFLQEKLLLALSPEVAEVFMSMWNGTISLSASQSADQENRLPDSLFSNYDYISVSYDEIGYIQTIDCTGVLDSGNLNVLEQYLLELVELPENDPNKITLVQKDLAFSLLTEIHEQQLSFFEEHIHKPIFKENPNSRFEDFFPITTDEKEKQQKAKKLGDDTLKYFENKTIKEYIHASLAGKFGLEIPFTKLLLSDSNILSVENYPLREIYSQAATSGVSLSFFKDESGEELIEPRIRKSSAIISAADLPSNTKLIMLEGYLECSDSAAYRLFIQGGNPGTALTLSMPHLPEPLIEISDSDGTEVSNLVELEANLPYKFTLRIKNFNAGEIGLLVQSESLPKGNLNQLKLYPQELIDRCKEANILLQKTTQIIQQFKLTEEEIRYLTSYPNHYYQFPFTNLPTRILDPSVGNDKLIIENIFQRFIRLGDFVSLRREIAADQPELVSLFQMASIDSPETNDDIIDKLAILTRRDSGLVTDIFSHFGYDANHIAEQDGLTVVWKAMKIIHKLGVPTNAVIEVTEVVSKTKTHEERYPLADSFKKTLKSKYTPGNWQRIAQSIYDGLRMRQRDALVAYIMHLCKFDRREQLFEYFLIDPGMEPVVQTSRIRLAISSIQTFIQRCLLNLELEVSPFMITKNHWEWMKSYRVWEANRKIFLFPENWLEPEFRDNKTHLFQELEGAILQGDTDQEIVERALFNYLKGLEKISRLSLMAMYLEEDPLNASGNTLHLIAKSFTAPEYYYRTYRNHMWTPWIPIPAQIEGEHLALVKWQGRIHVFWVTFLQKAESKQDDTSIEDAAQKTSNELIQNKVQIQLNWCEYYQGEWQVRETSGFEHSIEEEVTKEFDKRDVYIHPFVAYDENGRERFVLINLIGPIGCGFRLVSKLDYPRFDLWKAPMEPPYTYQARGETKYRVSGALSFSYIEQIVTVVETENGEITKDTTDPIHSGNIDLLYNPTFRCLFHDSPLQIYTGQEYNPADQENINNLLLPFFFEDDEHNITLYIEPELLEKTIVTWEEWLEAEEGSGDNFEKPDYWNDLRVVPGVDWSAFNESEQYVDPAGPVTRELMNMVTNPAEDWLLNPQTVVQFEEAFIGPRGGLIISRPEIGEAVGGEMTNVNPGSVIASGGMLVVAENPAAVQGNIYGVEGPTGSDFDNVNIVGQNGLNATLLKQMSRSVATIPH